MKLPVIFAGHGSPIIALEDNELTKEFQKIGERVVSEFEKPKAILSFSAHWFTRGTYVQSDPEPRQVYDMYGFPKELYEVQYHPKGCQELTDDILALLPDISINDDWGIDHGTWTVLVHMFPGAPIPVVQLSIDGIEGPQSAYDIGKALAPLREKGYLLLGSGNIVHNLRRLEWDTPTAPRRPTASTPSSRGSSKRETTKKSSTTKTTPTPPRQPTTSSPYFIH